MTPAIPEQRPTDQATKPLRAVPLVKRDVRGPVRKKMATDFVIVASITATTQIRFVTFSKQKRVQSNS